MTAGIGFDADRDCLYVNDGADRYFDPTLTFTTRVAADDIDTDVFIAPFALTITGIKSVVNVGASSATVQPRKCTGTTAIGSGTALTTAAIALDSTANTVTTATLSATAADLTFAAGDRLSLDYTGTLTGLSGAITITYKRV